MKILPLLLKVERTEAERGRYLLKVIRPVGCKASHSLSQDCRVLASRTGAPVLTFTAGTAGIDLSTCQRLYRGSENVAQLRGGRAEMQHCPPPADHLVESTPGGLHLTAYPMGALC